MPRRLSTYQSKGRETLSYAAFKSEKKTYKELVTSSEAVGTACANGEGVFCAPENGLAYYISEWKRHQNCLVCAAQGQLVCGLWLAHACQKLYLQAAAGISLPGRTVGRCCVLYRSEVLQAACCLLMRCCTACKVKIDGSIDKTRAKFGLAISMHEPVTSYCSSRPVQPLEYGFCPGLQKLHEAFVVERLT